MLFLYSFLKNVSLIGALFCLLSIVEIKTMEKVAYVSLRRIGNDAHGFMIKVPYDATGLVCIRDLQEASKTVLGEGNIMLANEILPPDYCMTVQELRKNTNLFHVPIPIHVVSVFLQLPQEGSYLLKVPVNPTGLIDISTLQETAEKTIGTKQGTIIAGKILSQDQQISQQELVATTLFYIKN